MSIALGKDDDLVINDSKEYENARNLKDLFFRGDGCRSDDLNYQLQAHREYLNSNKGTILSVYSEYSKLSLNHPDDWEAFFFKNYFEAISYDCNGLYESVSLLNNTMSRTIYMIRNGIASTETIEDILEEVNARIAFYISYYYFTKTTEYYDTVWEFETNKFANETASSYISNREIDNFGNDLKKRIKRYQFECDVMLTKVQKSFVDAIDDIGFETGRINNLKIDIWEGLVEETSMLLYAPDSNEERAVASQSELDYYDEVLKHCTKRIQSFKPEYSAPYSAGLNIQNRRNNTRTSNSQGRSIGRYILYIGLAFLVVIIGINMFNSNSNDYYDYNDMENDSGMSEDVVNEEEDYTDTEEYPDNGNDPYYVKGNQYEVQENLRVREGPGKNYRILNRSELTSGDFALSVDSDTTTDALIEKGKYVKCLGMEGDWMRIESGWVCTFDEGEVLVR